MFIVSNKDTSVAKDNKDNSVVLVTFLLTLNIFYTLF